MVGGRLGIVLELLIIARCALELLEEDAGGETTPSYVRAAEALRTALTDAGFLVGEEKR